MESLTKSHLLSISKDVKKEIHRNGSKICLLWTGIISEDRIPLFGTKYYELSKAPLFIKKYL